MSVFSSQRTKQSLLVWRIAGVGVTVAMVAAWWFLLASPLVSDRSQLQLQRAMEQTLQENENDITTRWQQALAEVQQSRLEEQQRSERASPQRDDAAFLRWVHDKASQHGMRLRDFRPTGEETLGNYQSKGILISAHGTYESLCRMLDQFRDSPHLKRITSLEISPRDSERTQFDVTWRTLLLTDRSTP